MKEEWKTLTQNNEVYDRYKISSYGRVWDTKNNKYVSQVLTGKPQYFYVNLQNEEGKWVLRRVHNCMCWTFKGTPPSSNHTVDHNDRNKYNNALYNISWEDKKTQSRNKDNRVMYEGVLLEDYLISKGHKKNTNLYDFLYRRVSLGSSYTEAIFDWADKVHSNPKLPKHSKDVATRCIKVGIIEKLSDVSIFYPNEKSYVEDKLEVSWNTYLKNRSNGETIEDAVKSKELLSWKFWYGGIFDTRPSHCDRIGVSNQRISALMSKHNISFEEAVKTPVQRVIKHSINGEVKRNSDWAIHFNIPPRSFNSALSKKRKLCKNYFTKTLQHYNVDTSTLEISPCDGDVVMKHFV